MQVDVGVDPQAAFLHVAVGDAQVVQQQLQLGEIGLGLGGRAQVGLADDLQQRRAGAVQVDAAVGLAGRSSCMLLPASSSRWARMMPISLRLEAALGVADRQPAVVAQRQVELADLVALGQVGIVIVLAVPLGEPRRSGSSSASAALTESSTARRFITGSVPGMPMHTGQVCVLGGAPNFVLHPQNNLLSVSSCTWTSRPMTMV